MANFKKNSWNVNRCRENYPHFFTISGAIFPIGGQFPIIFAVIRLYQVYL